MMDTQLNPAPAISVIIPVHNGAGTIGDCLSSIERSTFKDYEVIIVDDGSTDNTVEIARSFPCRVYRFESSRGAAFARNHGAQNARGRYLFFTDSDIMIQENTIEKIHALLCSDSGFHAVIGSYTKHTPVKNFFSVFKNYCHHFTHQKSREEAFTFWTGCGGIDRKIFLKFDGFSESFTSASIEDIEFGYRITRQGYRIKLEKSIQVTHLKHYTFFGLMRSDVLNRAVPWTRLMLQSHTFQSDLNTTVANAISVVTMQLFPFTMLGALRYPRLQPVILLEMCVFVLCNMDFYRFLLRNDRFGFVCKAVAMSFLYFYYSGIGLVLGFLAFLKDLVRS